MALCINYVTYRQKLEHPAKFGASKCVAISCYKKYLTNLSFFLQQKWPCLYQDKGIIYSSFRYKPKTVQRDGVCLFFFFF